MNHTHTHTHTSGLPLTGRQRLAEPQKMQISILLSFLLWWPLLILASRSSLFLFSISLSLLLNLSSLHERKWLLIRSVSKLLEACYCWWQMNDIGIEASQAQGEPLSNGNRSRERERERSQHNEKAIYFSNKDKCATLISVWLI